MVAMVLVDSGIHLLIHFNGTTGLLQKQVQKNFFSLVSISDS